MIMKKNTIIAVCCAIVFSLFIYSVYASGLMEKVAGNSTADKKVPAIIIDAGHGGADGGAVAPDGTIEKDINLAISLKLESMLKMFGYNTIMTRKDDNSIHDESASTLRQQKVSDIHNRFKIIEDNPDSLFVSIHQNKYGSSKYSGAQVFYSPNNPLSVDLANCIQKSIVNLIQPENTREIKKSGTEIYLLYHAKSTAVMVECGFVSNYDELQKLKDDKYQQEIAFAVFCGINDYLKLCEKG